MVEAQVQAMMEHHMLNVAQTVEAELDAKMKQMDDLDEDDLEKIRERRLQQMRKMNEKKQEWRNKGHGTYSEITSEKEFFEAAKKSENFVCHFYRPSTPRCQIVDKHLAIIAQKHLECRFVRINAEKCPFLVEKFLVVVLPTVTLCKAGKVLDHIVGFDDVGGCDDFETPVYEWRIACQGVIKVDYDVHDGPLGHRDKWEQGPKGGSKMGKVRAGVYSSRRDGDSDDDLDLDSD
ncbi:MAG: thioredoxin domain-containing protein [Promethearchaeia archaeon]|jgi:hypothetical protein